MENQKGVGMEWDKALANRIGEAVKARRTELGWTASRLSEEAEKLGYPIHRVAIGKLENGHRGAKFDVAELVVLAEALDIPPVQLLFPGLMSTPTEHLPGKTTTAWDALKMFTGELGRSQRKGRLAPEPGREYHLWLMRDLDANAQEIHFHQEMMELHSADGNEHKAAAARGLSTGLLKYQESIKQTLERDGFVTGSGDQGDDAEK